MIPFELETMQWIGSTALTLASVTIAFVAATFGYRQNFGWRPILLVTSEGIGFDAEESGDRTAYLYFEFWNRRKYPIVLRDIRITFQSLPITGFPKTITPVETEEWDLTPYSMDGPIEGLPRFELGRRRATRLDPSSHLEFSPRFTFRHAGSSDVRDRYTIELTHFDPIANRLMKQRIEAKYSF